MLGFCGSFYAVQYAQPLTQLLRQTSQPKDVLRFRIAKLLLDLVRQFENKKQQIHMCDVKLVSLCVYLLIYFFLTFNLNKNNLLLGY